MLQNPLLLALYASSEDDADVAATPGWAGAYYVDRCFADSDDRGDSDGPGAEPSACCP